jgi:hypothetical protein
MRGVNARSALTLIALAAATAPPVVASPAVSVETRVVLHVEALVVTKGRTKPTGVVRDAEIGPSQPGTIDLVVPWRPGGGTVTVHLTVRFKDLSPDGEAVLQLASDAGPTDGTTVAASREIRLAEEGSALFEVYGDEDRRLLLTLQGERVERAVVRPPIVVGAPVRFSIAIQRVDGDRAVLLETNELHTFVGQAVEYSFRLGQDAGLEAVRLSVLPVSISGDVVTIDAEISGALPGAEGTVLVSRNERIVASRGATSPIAATAGTPPAGYRFQVTPDF